MPTKAPDLAEYIKHSGQEKLSRSAFKSCDFYRRPQNLTTVYQQKDKDNDFLLNTAFILYLL